MNIYIWLWWVGIGIACLRLTSILHSKLTGGVSHPSPEWGV